MTRWLGALAVLTSVALACIAQITIKHQLAKIGASPPRAEDWPRYAFTLLTDGWILASFALAFVGAMIYLFAISHLNITYLYPFASLSFPAILFLGSYLLGEPLSWQKVLGSSLIMAGVLVSAMSQG